MHANNYDNKEIDFIKTIKYIFKHERFEMSKITIFYEVRVGSYGRPDF